MRPAAITVVLRPAMSPDDTHRVVARVECLLRADLSVVCDVAGQDLAVVDVLARVRLVAQRLGACERLHVSGLARVADLAELAGLGQVLGEAEPREQ